MTELLAYIPVLIVCLWLLAGLFANDRAGLMLLKHVVVTALPGPLAYFFCNTPMVGCISTVNYAPGSRFIHGSFMANGDLGLFYLREWYYHTLRQFAEENEVSIERADQMISDLELEDA